MKDRDKDKLIHHRPNCVKPKIVRGYERGYDDEDKRTWILASLRCVGCGVIVVLPHKPNLTTKQREKLMKKMPKLPSYETLKQDLELDSQVNKEDIDNEYLYTEGKTTRPAAEQTQAYRRKKDMIGEYEVNGIPRCTKFEQWVMYDKEKKLRSKVRELNGIYKKDEKLCPRLKGKINWDPKLLERFLDTRPTIDVIRKVLLWPPLLRYSRERANHSRGWIPSPNPEHWGHTEYDDKCYDIKACFWRYRLYGETPPDPESINLDELSEWEKLVIVESKGRKKFLESVIKKYNESQTQVYHTTDEIKVTNRKKKKK